MEEQEGKRKECGEAEGTNPLLPDGGERAEALDPWPPASPDPRLHWREKPALPSFTLLSRSWPQQSPADPAFMPSSF